MYLTNMTVVIPNHNHETARTGSKQPSGRDHFQNKKIFFDSQYGFYKGNEAEEAIRKESHKKMGPTLL